MGRINPNMITSLRFFFFGPMACFCLTNGHLIWALLAMILGEFTDFLDGFVARRTNQVSNLGKVFDPMCDSVFHMVIWMSMLATGWVSVYFVILFFVRDTVVSTIRICLASHGIVLAARKSGKIKAASQATAQITIVVIHLWLTGNLLESLQLLTVSLAALVTLFSLCDYSWGFYQLVKGKATIFN